ncbi:ABC transporter permease [Phenylobacterium sp.]|jgi:ABC-2 type transport system permease protein|uniref:ABC transporter permease n=1 Tax=Phenylobacterium sp. TaxID=1871053 RepID=UPI002E33DC27|nr:ABC transporter permease [Phenylobacterium sp.]HEX4711042.1 ABC transporter permease [Phenylobacterium sp.]
MMQRLGLIAGREIAAYAGVPSFWAALLMGPLLMLLAALAGGALHHAPSAQAARAILIEAADPALGAAARDALAQAADLEGRAVSFPADRSSGGVSTTVSVGVDPSGAVSARLSGDRLPPAALALLRRDLGQAGLQGRLRQAGASQALLAAAQAVPVNFDLSPIATAPPADPGRFGRFAVMMLLWLNLVGALGMLLQAIVRERANRALESLLSAARPSEIIFGKLAGVGALSLLVLSAWLAAGAAIAATPLGGAGAGMIGFLLHAFAAPLALLQAALIYVLAFAMYGSAMIGLGAIARDVPSAQNLSRPVFGVLLLVFFIALAQLGGGAQGMAWLAWIPLFTPFILLMEPPGTLDLAQTVVALGGMASATAVFGWMATRALTDSGLKLHGKRRRPAALASRLQPADA